MGLLEAEDLVAARVLCADLTDMLRHDAGGWSSAIEHATMPAGFHEARHQTSTLDRLDVRRRGGRPIAVRDIAASILDVFEETSTSDYSVELRPTIEPGRLELALVRDAA